MCKLKPGLGQASWDQLPLSHPWCRWSHNHISARSSSKPPDLRRRFEYNFLSLVSEQVWGLPKTSWGTFSSVPPVLLFLRIKASRHRCQVHFCICISRMFWILASLHATSKTHHFFVTVLYWIFMFHFTSAWNPPIQDGSRSSLGILSNQTRWFWVAMIWKRWIMCPCYVLVVLPTS